MGSCEAALWLWVTLMAVESLTEGKADGTDLRAFEACEPMCAVSAKATQRGA